MTAPMTGLLTIEKLGGLAGFGGPNLQSRGTYAYADLSPADRATVDALFKHGDTAAPKGSADGFMYRLSRAGPKGEETVEAPAGMIPQVLADAVVDGFR